MAHSTAPGTYAVSYTATVNTNATGTVGNNVAATGGGGNPYIGMLRTRELIRKGAKR